MKVITWEIGRSEKAEKFLGGSSCLNPLIICIRVRKNWKGCKVLRCLMEIMFRLHADKMAEQAMIQQWFRAQCPFPDSLPEGFSFAVEHYKEEEHSQTCCKCEEGFTLFKAARNLRIELWEFFSLSHNFSKIFLYDPSRMKFFLYKQFLQ